MIEKASSMFIMPLTESIDNLPVLPEAKVPGGNVSGPVGVSVHELLGERIIIMSEAPTDSRPVDGDLGVHMKLEAEATAQRERDLLGPEFGFGTDAGESED